MGLLGAEFVEAGAGTCVIEAPYRDERTQQERYFHGAVTGAIADTAEGYAALTLAPLTKRHSRPSIQDQLPRPSARREARGWRRGGHGRASPVRLQGRGIGRGRWGGRTCVASLQTVSLSPVKA
jgi:hypothetical protein